MTFPKDIADHHKENLKQKCFYLVNLFKSKDLAAYEKHKARLATLKVEDSWEFYHELLVEYQTLVDQPDLKDVVTEAAKVVVEKVLKKAPAPVKKAVKKVAKKVAKKVEKKPAKKVEKKAPAKKTAKKVTKKPATKKVVKKKK